MRMAFAPVALLAFAAWFGPEVRADDPPAVAPSRGFLGRFRRPEPVEVPPSATRRPPGSTASSPPATETAWPALPPPPAAPPANSTPPATATAWPAVAPPPSTTPAGRPAWPAAPPGQAADEAVRPASGSSAPPKSRAGALRAIPTGKGPSKPAAEASDATVRRVQATPTDMGAAIAPGAAQPAALSSGNLSLQQALYGALTSNPDLIALRTGNGSAASAEAVEVARRFPVTLNPTVFIDYRPITLIPQGTFGANSPGGSGSTTNANGTTTASNKGGYYHNGQGYLLVALRQPIELGHQTTHRHSIAKAAYNQVQWQIVQAELNSLVQTYRFFQTAAYRREKLRVATQLADFNEKLLDTLERRLAANAPQTQPADVALQRVEARATRQQSRAARQDYITALTDLRNQIGIPEAAAETEPLGEFTLPETIPALDEQALVEAALRCRPDLHAAQAQIAATAAGVRLARGDRIPSLILGPEYAQDEAGLQYVGFNLIPILPILNNGKPLLRQREAEQRRATVAYDQARQRAVAQVRAAVAKWNGATGLVTDSSGLTRQLGDEVNALERLFEANQTDISRVTQARQRLIQLENAELDALWAATQAQADLMAALGIPSLIQGMLQAAEGGAGVAPGIPPDPAGGAGPVAAPPMAPTPSPFAPPPG